VLTALLLYNYQTRFEEEKSMHAGTAAVGGKALDIEGGAPPHGDDSAAGKDTAAHAPVPPSGPSFEHQGSLIERINTAPASPRKSVLGRRSGGVTRLPPPTL
jgi:hypothetical protein